MDARRAPDVLGQNRRDSSAKAIDWRRVRVRFPRPISDDESPAHFKPRGDSDDATRQPAESRSPCHGPVAQHRVQTASFDPATSARERDGSSRSNR